MKKKTKLRPLGDILLDLESLTDEAIDSHGMQWGDLLHWLYGHLMIHRPDAREEYLDGTHPEFNYGSETIYEIQLTKNQKVSLDKADYEEQKKYNWQAYKFDSGYYAGRSVRTPEGKKMIYMHREILKAKPNEIVDHINHITLDNRKKNLRICSHKDNIRYSKKSITNTTGYKGVQRQKGSKTWIARITVNGKHIVSKGYLNIKDAAKEYNRMAIKYFGEYAYINKIEE